MKTLQENPMTITTLKDIFNCLPEKVETCEIIKLYPHTNPKPNSAVSITSFPDKEDILLMIGTERILLRNQDQLIRLTAALDKLCFQSLTTKESKLVKKELLKDTQYIDVVDSMSLYNYYLDNYIDIEKLSTQEQVNFLDPNSDYQLDSEKVIQQLNFNTKSMFSKEVIPSEKQRLLTGELSPVGNSINQSTSIFDKIANKENLSVLIDELKTTYMNQADEAATLGTLLNNMDSVDASVYANNLIAKYRNYISNNGLNINKIETILTLVMSSDDNKLLSFSQEDITNALGYIKFTLESTIQVIGLIDPDYVTDINVNMITFQDHNVTADKLIMWSKDATKGPKYCEEQLARLPLEVKDRLIKEVEAKI